MWTRKDLLERISANPDVCFGKPVIKGTRIWISLILDLMANGLSETDILAEYPQLTREDIHAALAYGSLAAQERYIPIGSGKTDEN